jgi:hypothetical protein
MRSRHVRWLLAVAAMATLVCAGNASASEFEAGEGGKAITATTLTQHVLTLTGSNFKCNTTKFEGTTESTAVETQKVHPTYESCTAFGFSGATVTTKGCDFEFSANTSSGMGNLNIVDHAGETCNGIVITADSAFGNCTAAIPKQTISGAANYTNNSGKLKIKTTASGMELNVTVSTGICPLAIGSHTGETGAGYSGESELSAAGTTLGWFEAPPVPPNFAILNKPAGLVWKPGETKAMKIEDTGAGGGKWNLITVGTQQQGGNWNESEQANCQGKLVVEGSEFECEWKIKCETAGKTALVEVFWEKAGRKGTKPFGPLECFK